MDSLRQCVLALVLLSAAVTSAQQTLGDQQHSAAPANRETQRHPKPVQDEPALPQSPGATLREQMRDGMRAEPPCRGLYPCRLTARQKLHMFVKRSYSPYTFAEAAFDAGYSQFTGEDYGRGMTGFSQRIGANLADSEARSFFQTFVYSAWFGQDPRYHRLDRGTFPFRASYAASRVIIGRTDDGRSAINFPELLGVATATTLSNAYYPDRDRGVGRSISRGFGDLLSDAGSNLLREFWPDIRRTLRHHEPHSIQRLEDKISTLNYPGKRHKPEEEPAGGDQQQ